MGVVIRPNDDNDDAIPIARFDVDDVADRFNTGCSEVVGGIAIQFVRHLYKSEELTGVGAEPNPDLVSASCCGSAEASGSRLQRSVKFSFPAPAASSAGGSVDDPERARLETDVAAPDVVAGEVRASLLQRPIADSVDDDEPSKRCSTEFNSPGYVDNDVQWTDHAEVRQCADQRRRRKLVAAESTAARQQRGTSGQDKSGRPREPVLAMAATDGLADRKPVHHQPVVGPRLLQDGQGSPLLEAERAVEHQPAVHHSVLQHLRQQPDDKFGRHVASERRHDVPV